MRPGRLKETCLILFPINFSLSCGLWVAAPSQLLDRLERDADQPQVVLDVVVLNGGEGWLESGPREAYRLPAHSGERRLQGWEVLFHSFHVGPALRLEEVVQVEQRQLGR